MYKFKYTNKELYTHVHTCARMYVPTQKKMEKFKYHALSEYNSIGVLDVGACLPNLNWNNNDNFPPLNNGVSYKRQ